MLLRKCIMGPMISGDSHVPKNKIIVINIRNTKMGKEGTALVKRRFALIWDVH